MKEAFIEDGHEGKILIYDGLEGFLEGRVEEVNPEKDYLNTTLPPYPFEDDNKSRGGSSLG